MKKRIGIIICSVLLISMLSILLVGCANTSFKSITNIRKFDDIRKIEVLNVIDSSDNKITGANIRVFEKDNEIMAIYNILNNAKYSVMDNNKHQRSDFVLRIYVKGYAGYIEYDWDSKFEGKNGFNGKLKEGSYSMADAHKAQKKLEEIFLKD